MSSAESVLVISGAVFGVGAIAGGVFLLRWSRRSERMVVRPHRLRHAVAGDPWADPIRPMTDEGPPGGRPHTRQGGDPTA